MDASPVFSHSITMERGVREKHTTDGITAVRNLAVEHESEKRELQHLNEKFSSYLQRVRQLEAQNKQLEADVNEVRKKWGFETADIRKQFDKDLDDLRFKIDDAESKKSLSQVRLKSAEYNADIVRGKIDFLNTLSNDDKQKLQFLLQQKEMFLPEMNALDSRYKDLQADIERLKGDLFSNLSKLEDFTNDLDNNTFDRVRLQNQIQTLKDQLVFLKALYEEEIREFQNLAIPQFDMSQFYRTELTKAINDIRKDFETLNRAQQDEIHSYYRTRMDQIRQQVDEEKRKVEEAKKTGHVEVMDFTALKDTLDTTAKEKADLEGENGQLTSMMRAIENDILALRASRDRAEADREMKLMQLNAELQAIKDTLQTAIEGNVSLRFEINTYRRLLESQEFHLNAGAASAAAYGGGVTSSISSTQRYASSSGGAAAAYGSERVGGGSSFYQDSFGGGHPFEASTSPAGFGGADFLGGGSPMKKVSHGKRRAGPIDIDENDLSERCITLKNESAHDIDIGDWYINQRDGVKAVKYFIPHNLHLRPNSFIKIYSKSGSNYATSQEEYLVADYIDKWLSSARVETILHKPNGDEVAQIVTEWSV